MSSLGTALVAVLAIVLVVRHSRAEEESGRTELLGATVVGRFAPPTAALLLAGLTNLALGSATTLGLEATVSLAFGLAWAAAGIPFTGLAGLAPRRGARCTPAGPRVWVGCWPPRWCYSC